MTTLLQSLFYLWLVVSVLLVTMWFLRRQDRMRDAPDPDTLLPGFDGPILEESPPVQGTVSSETSDESETSTDDEAVANESEDSEGHDKVDEVEPDTDEPVEDAAVEDTAAEDEPVEDEPAEDAAVEDAAAEDTAVVATEAVCGNAGSVEHEPEEPEASTIDAMLDGIDLPFDLTPIEPTGEDPDRYAVFLSPHQDPAQVGTAFADQLAELGFEIEPAGFDEAVARRNGDVLTMRIGSNARPEDDEGRRFPMASDSDVAIEVWTGTGPPPQPSN